VLAEVGAGRTVAVAPGDEGAIEMAGDDGAAVAGALGRADAPPHWTHVRAMTRR
jgi:hypothetical protein